MKNALFSCRHKSHIVISDKLCFISMNTYIIHMSILSVARETCPRVRMFVELVVFWGFFFSLFMNFGNKFDRLNTECCMTTLADNIFKQIHLTPVTSVDISRIDVFIF